MNLNGLLDLLGRQESYRALLADLKPGASLGLIRPARPFVVAGLARDTVRPVVVITSRIDLAHNLSEQLRAWSPNLSVLTYTEPNPIFYERAPWGPRSTQARLQVLAALSDHSQLEYQADGLVVVTSARALMQRTLPLEEFNARCITLQSGALAPGGNPEALLHLWLGMGYEPASLVTEPGAYSRRGGILDIFPVAADYPVRVEFWGDEIESLRSFDPATQRSESALTHVLITPAREAFPVHAPQVAAPLEPWFTQFADDEDAASPRADWHPLSQGIPFQTLEFYLPWMYEHAASLLEYLPGNALVLVDDLLELSDTVADLEQQALSLHQSHLASGDIPPDMPLPNITWAQISEELSQGAALQ